MRAYEGCRLDLVSIEGRLRHRRLRSMVQIPMWNVAANRDELHMALVIVAAFSLFDVTLVCILFAWVSGEWQPTLRVEDRGAYSSLTIWFLLKRGVDRNRWQLRCTRCCCPR